MVNNKLLIAGLCLFVTMTFLGFAVALTIDFGIFTESSEYLNVNGFAVNASSDDLNSNISINLYNSTGDLINQTNSTNDSLFVNFTNLTDGIYYYNATLMNGTGDIVNQTETGEITIDTTIPLIEFVVPSSSQEYQNTRDILVNVSASDTNLGVITINISKIGWSNKTSSSPGDSSLYLNYSNLTDGTYSVSAVVNDSAGNVNSTTESIVIDTVAPEVTLISPEEDYTWDTDSRITFEFEVTDASGSIANCSLYIDEELNGTANTAISVNTSEHIHSTDIENGPSYAWKIGCYDSAGNYNESEEWLFDLDYNPDDSSDSGGGGGGDDTSTTKSFWTNTYTVGDDAFTFGYKKELAKGNRVRVNVNNETHYVGVINMSATQVIINVSSDPQTATFSVGETKKFEVNIDGYYDISVKLNAINGTKANLTITSIYEKISLSTGNQTVENTTRNLEIENQTVGATLGEVATLEVKSANSSKWFWIVLIVILLAAGGAAYYFFVFKKKASRRVKTN